MYPTLLACYLFYYYLDNTYAQKILNDNNYDNSEYGYIEAYGDQAKKSDSYGSEYNNDDDDYEYEDDPDGAIHSVGLDAEVREHLP